MPAIVTRPEKEALRWAERLRSHGIEAQVLPLIVIEPAADVQPLRSAWGELPRYGAVMFVSGAAVDHFFRAKPAGAGFSPRAWAPGAGTRDALLQAGLAPAQIDAPAEDAAQFDSEALWQQVGSQLHGGERVLIVRGGDAQAQPAGREWLQQRLAAAGVGVEQVVAYRRTSPDWDAGQVALARQAATDGSTWLFSSSEAVANLRSLLPQQGWAAARALATHGRIAEAARAAGFGRVLTCRPAFEDVLASLQSAR